MRLFDHPISEHTLNVWEFAFNAKLIMGIGAIAFLLIIRRYFPHVEERINNFCLRI